MLFALSPYYNRSISPLLVRVGAELAKMNHIPSRLVRCRPINPKENLLCFRYNVKQLFFLSKSPLYEGLAVNLTITEITTALQQTLSKQCAVYVSSAPTC